MMNNLEVLDYLCKQYKIDENVYKEFLEDTDINRNIWLVIDDFEDYCEPCVDGLCSVSDSWELELVAAISEKIMPKEDIVSIINGLDFSDWEYEGAYWDYEAVTNYIKKTIKPLQEIYQISNNEIHLFIKNIKNLLESCKIPDYTYAEEAEEIIKKYKEELLSKGDVDDYECPFHTENPVWDDTYSYDRAIDFITSDDAFKYRFLCDEVCFTFDAIMDCIEDIDSNLYNRMYNDFCNLLKENDDYCCCEYIAKSKEYLKQEYNITIENIENIDYDDNDAVYWMDDCETEEEFWEHEI